jgi:hypothetical protein
MGPIRDPSVAGRRLAIERERVTSQVRRQLTRPIRPFFDRLARAARRDFFLVTIDGLDDFVTNAESFSSVIADHGRQRDYLQEIDGATGIVTVQ